MQTGPVSIPAVSTSLRTDTFSPYRAGGSVFTSQRSLVLWGRSAVIGDLINTPSDSRGRHRARVQRILKPPPPPRLWRQRQLSAAAGRSSHLQNIPSVIVHLAVINEASTKEITSENILFGVEVHKTFR